MCSFSAWCIVHTWLHISWALAGCLNVSWLIFDGEHLGTHAIKITQINSQNDEDDSDAWSHGNSNNSLPMCKKITNKTFTLLKQEALATQHGERLSLNILPFWFQMSQNFGAGIFPNLFNHSSLADWARELLKASKDLVRPLFLILTNLVSFGFRGDIINVGIGLG